MGCEDPVLILCVTKLMAKVIRGDGKYVGKLGKQLGNLRALRDTVGLYCSYYLTTLLLYLAESHCFVPALIIIQSFKFTWKYMVQESNGLEIKSNEDQNVIILTMSL